VCALVEYEKTEFAMKAVAEMTCEEQDKMKVSKTCVQIFETFFKQRVPELHIRNY
jgi:hypothetical protein